MKLPVIHATADETRPGVFLIDEERGGRHLSYATRELPAGAILADGTEAEPIRVAAGEQPSEPLPVTSPRRSRSLPPPAIPIETDLLAKPSPVIDETPSGE